ncbi:uncharacterized protein LOC114361333 [Ostrinia furnacalis]|uniref:uncharacterized protein LOC114361333 n=1 Tax=Ostrinia furnacalis TaxID=93504 RepID=UPI00103E3A5C|nr:uncharacterized protein LOC114361333 [Ostrinia furnacalis]
MTMPALEHSTFSTMTLQQEYLPAESNILSVPRESTSATEPAQNSGSLTMILPVEPNNSNALRESTSTTIPAQEHSTSLTMTLQQECLPAEPYILSVSRENYPGIGADENILSTVNSPRKRRLQQTLNKKQNIIKKQTRELKTLRQKVKRLQNRNRSLKDILKSLKDSNYVDTETFNKLKDNLVPVDLFNNMNRKKQKKNIKYTPAVKKFCLTLNYYSPKAYNYVRQTFNTCLPHLKTLSKWYGHIKGDPGFTEESFQVEMRRIY